MDSNYTEMTKQNFESPVDTDHVITPFIPWNIWTLAIAIVTCLLWFESRRRTGGLRRGVEASTLPPGGTGWPIIGETVEFILDGRKYFRSRRQKFGPIFSSHLMGKPAVVVVGAANLRRVFTASETEVVQGVPPAANALFGDNALCTSTGQCHRRLQRAVLRAFSHRNLASMTPAIHDITRRHISKWITADVVNCCEEVRLMTFEVSNESLLGFEFCDKELHNIMNSFRKISNAFFSFPINLPGFAFHKGSKARDMVMEMISEKPRRVGPGGYSLLDHMREDEQASEEEISAMALELMFGGLETTASSSCAVLITLSSHPEVREKIRDELRDYCRTHESSLETLTFHDIVSLKYTGDVVKELVRLKPSVAGVFRKTVKPIAIGKYQIPENYMVLCGITDTHEASPHFDDTTEFRPERWQELRDKQDRAHAALNDGSKLAPTMDSFDYLPFGRGRRHCVGKELAKLVLKLFVLELSARCDWTLINGEPKINTAPLPFPADGLPIKFRARQL